MVVRQGFLLYHDTGLCAWVSSIFWQQKICFMHIDGVPRFIHNKFIILTHQLHQVSDLWSDTCQSSTCGEVCQPVMFNYIN